MYKISISHPNYENGLAFDLETNPFVVENFFVEKDDSQIQLFREIASKFHGITILFIS